MPIGAGNHRGFSIHSQADVYHFRNWTCCLCYFKIMQLSYLIRLQRLINVYFWWYPLL